MTDDDKAYWDLKIPSVGEFLDDLEAAGYKFISWQGNVIEIRDYLEDYEDHINKNNEVKKKNKS